MAVEGEGRPRQLVSIEASLPVYSSEQEIKQSEQEICMDEQRASRKCQTEERILWDVGKGTGHMGEL